MNIKLEFLIYCIEEYKRLHEISGKETFRLFEQSGAGQYIIDHYDALHTAGVEYTLYDIKELISAGQTKSS